MGDTFTGGKREIDTQGGDYYEKVENLYQAAPTGVDARFQLPSSPADFTGRAAELNNLRAAAASGAARIFGLRGQGGVGKTALALVLAHELAPQYADAQIYLDLQGTTTPLTPGAVMAHTIRAFLPTAQLPADDAGLAAAYRHVLSDKRALLFYDNARDAAQVTPLLPPAGCLLLVTSRQRFTLPGLRPLNLDTLPRADSITLLLAIAPRLGEHADAIAQLCGDLPLALRLAGSALAERDDLTPQAYAAKLSTEQGRKKELNQVMASLALSYDLLDAGLQAVWHALAVFAGDFDQHAAAVVLDLDDSAAGDALGGLLKYCMVEFRPESNRYRLHDLARDAAGVQLVGEEYASAERRYAVYYMGVLSTATSLLLDGGERVLVGRRLFDQEWANIEAGQAWAAAHAANDDEAAQLCDEYANSGVYVLDLRQRPRERIAWMESALSSARRLGNKAREGLHLGNLALTYGALGNMRHATELYEQQLAVVRIVGSHRGEGVALGNLGNAYLDLGEPRRAIEYHQQALVIHREIGDRRGEGNAHWNMSLALDKLGKRADAIASAEAALRLYEQIEDPNVEKVRRKLAAWNGSDEL